MQHTLGTGDNGTSLNASSPLTQELSDGHSISSEDCAGGEEEGANSCGNNTSFCSDGVDNLLVYLYRFFCRKHRSRCVSQDVIAQLAGFSPWIATVTVEVNSLKVAMHLPHLTELNLDRFYIGGRQVMALADLICTSGSKREAPCANVAVPHASDGYTLVPHLSKLSLRDAKLDFGQGQEEGYWLKEQMADFPKGGNTVFSYLFRSLRGHPSLATLDLRGNAIGPFLLPEILRLVRATPFLVTLHLTHTLLSPSEVEVAESRCQLNRLRQDKLRSTMAEGDVPKESSGSPRRHFTEHTPPHKWIEAQVNAVIQQLAPRTTILRDDENAGLPCMPEEGCSPYIKVECPLPMLVEIYTQQVREVDEALEGSSSGLAFSSLCSDLDNFTSCGEVHTKAERSAGSDSAQLCEPVQFCLLREVLTHILYLPYLCYFLPQEVPALWSSACVEVVRSAFIDPMCAQLTFLCGRAVPSGIPRPLNATAQPASRAPSVLTPEQRQRLRDALENSTLMRRLFHILLPPPPKPPSLFGDLARGNPQYRTIAEENYFTVLDKQRNQRNFLLSKLVDSVVPMHYTRGAVLFEEGQNPQWLFFIPPPLDGQNGFPQEPSTWVHVQLAYASHARETGSENATQTLDGAMGGGAMQYIIYGEGEFVGEMELLGGAHHYVSRGGLARAAHPPQMCLKKQRLLELQRHKNYCSTATLQDQRETAAPADDASVLLWQLPKEVAFFYFYHPFQQFHERAAAIFENFPMLQHLSPMSAAAIAYAIELFVVELSRKEMALDGIHTSVGLIADSLLLNSCIFLLEDGDYIFSTFTALGGWIDQMLFQGSIVQSAATHKACPKAQEAGHPTGGLLLPCNVMLGKKVALRQFREAKRRKQHIMKNATEVVKEETNDCSLNVNHESSGVRDAFGAPRQGEQRLSVDASCLENEDDSRVHCWRYCTISNERFFALPEEARLALTTFSTAVAQESV